MYPTRRRRLALYIISWLYKFAFWLDVHTAPKYDRKTWPTLEMSDEEWDEWIKQINVDDEGYTWNA